MSLSEIEIPAEPLSPTDKYCAECPELGCCAVIGGLMMLEEWNEKNPALSEDREDDGTTEWKDLRDIVSIRSSAGDLFVDLSEVQVECVASMQAGGESLQNTANTLIKNSVAGKYARRKVN